MTAIRISSVARPGRLLLLLLYMCVLEGGLKLQLSSRPLARAIKGTAISELPALLWQDTMAGSMGPRAAAGLPCLSQGRLTELPVWGSAGVVYRSAACCMGRGAVRSGVVGPWGTGLS